MKKKNIPFAPPDVGDAEIEEVVQALRSGWITTGPKVKAFENEIAKYCHAQRAVCLNSATACMELTLRLFGIGPGDEVITTAYTYTATCSVICHVGAKPVLIDVKQNSYEMDYEQLSEKITNKTKAIIPVDLAGIMCNYDQIYKVIEANKYKFCPSNKFQEALGRILVLADAAHAFGSSRKGNVCGEVADFTSFSFHAVKNLTTAEGGAVVWKDIPGIDNEYIYKQYQLYSLHGQTKDALNKTSLGSWEYDILFPAYKCNMTDITAGIGLAQLKRYSNLLLRRKEIIDMYNKSFINLHVQLLNHYDEEHESSGHLYMIRVNDIGVEQRNALIIQMAEKGIACNVHYKPLPMLTAYKSLGFDIKDFPNAYRQYENEITLPLRSNLTNDEVTYIIKCFTGVLKDV
ncbi:aminotransferase class I/II-fold pyridoxal phosphate-dependent enzyme [Clostridiaceae bacterium DONG20-135]|uniref:Aminotransferase class I/II-fold pyridoxal phosphate-dependent enzyme n=1 Tax=Copranaerobaculum intestinale TaxID=2692629 RepID=A0A6N8U5H4_9FIRM|nr:DegT/DnrJ/EryC1/StrS aminotransferase family protein [Copranaerobaculum intestinale]MXQ72765.1 aminotransferase class I/II-fold pyridoxal phosphate-dependent enzyme [Copranaerobaculum intestinale]